MRQLVPLLNPAIFYAAKFLCDKSSLGLHDMGSTIDAGENNDAMQMHHISACLARGTQRGHPPLCVHNHPCMAMFKITATMPKEVRGSFGTVVS